MAHCPRQSGTTSSSEKAKRYSNWHSKTARHRLRQPNSKSTSTITPKRTNSVGFYSPTKLVGNFFPIKSLSRHANTTPASAQPTITWSITRLLRPKVGRPSFPSKNSIPTACSRFNSGASVSRGLRETTVFNTPDIGSLPTHPECSKSKCWYF